MKFGFPSAVRLRHGWQFDLVFRTGRRETSELVRLLFLEHNKGRSLIGVTVGRKMSNAVGRSRGRRMMRESFRKLLPWIRDGVWVVASLKESALDKSAKDVYLDVARALKRRGLLDGGWPGPDWDLDRKIERCV